MKKTYNKGEVKMKKFIVIALMLLTAPAFAAQTQKEIIDTTLSKSAWDTSGYANTKDAQKIMFFVNYDS